MKSVFCFLLSRRDSLINSLANPKHVLQFIKNIYNSIIKCLKLANELIGLSLLLNKKITFLWTIMIYSIILITMKV